MVNQYKIKTLVPDVDWTKTDTELANYCNHKLRIKNIKCIKSRENDWEVGGVCFNYALDDDLIKSIGEAFSYLKKEYKQIALSQAGNGDIIIYSDKYDNIEHFAKIYKTNNTLKSTIIRSKWGTFGIFETDLGSVPKIYGNFITIWKRKI